MDLWCYEYEDNGRLAYHALAYGTRSQASVWFRQHCAERFSTQPKEWPWTALAAWAQSGGPVPKGRASHHIHYETSERHEHLCHEHVRIRIWKMSPIQLTDVGGDTGKGRMVD